jgi:uncharacterized protein YbaP (TraB family)
VGIMKFSIYQTSVFLLLLFFADQMALANDRQTPYYEIVNSKGVSSYILGTVHINSIDLNLLPLVKKQITQSRIVLLESAQFGKTLAAQEYPAILNDPVLTSDSTSNQLTNDALARIQTILSVSDENIMSENLRLRVLKGNISRGFLFSLLGKFQNRMAYLIMDNNLQRLKTSDADAISDLQIKTPLVFDAQIEREARNHKIPIIALDMELYPLIEHYNQSISSKAISEWITGNFLDLDMVSISKTKNPSQMSDSLINLIARKTNDQKIGSLLGDLYQNYSSVTEIQTATEHSFQHASSTEREISHAITTRHLAWMSRIQNEFETGNAFIAVGLDHVVSAENYPSLLDLLQAKGFKIIPHQILKTKNICESVFASAS